MDPDDPIQLFLKTTGWSRDDLLAKLQKYEAPKDPLDVQQTSTESDETENIVVKDPLSNTNEDATTTNIADPDDEEQEVNGVNEDEIIEYLNRADKRKDSNSLTLESKLNETDTPDVTEVRVVEVSEDDLDKDDEEGNIFNPEEIESLEKYQNSNNIETITIETEYDEPADKKINYVEIDPSQKFKLCRYSTKPTQRGKYTKFKVSKVGTLVKNSTILSERKGKQQIFRPKLVIKKTLQKFDSPQIATKSCSTLRPVIINKKSEKSLVLLRQDTASVSKVIKSPLQSVSSAQPTQAGNIVTGSKYQNMPNITRVVKSSTESVNPVRPTILPQYVANLANSPNKKCQSMASFTRVVKSPDNNRLVNNTTTIPKSALPLKRKDSFDSAQIKYKIFASDRKHISSPKAVGNNSPTALGNKDLSKSATLFRLGNGGGLIQNERIPKITLPVKSPTETDTLSPIKIPENPMSLLKPIILDHTIPKIISDEKKICKDVPSELDSVPTETSAESNNMLPVDSEDENVEETSTSVEAYENIRNNLKLQLSSLRTKKKSQFLETTSTKGIDNIQCSRKLSLLESIESCKKHISNKALEKSSSQTDKNLYTQTNELGFVISNVQGGVETDDSESFKLKTKDNDSNVTKNESNEQNENADISHDNKFVEEDHTTANDSEEIRVLDEIRKIINKQKLPPKLSISKSNDNSLCFQKRLPKTDEDKKMDISCENSQTSFNEVEEKSPFVSDSLDEFLTANTKLNISYQVPKLGAEEGLKNFTEESPLILKKIEHIKENDEIKENLEDRTKITPTVKAKTVAQKRRLLEKERRKELRKEQKKKLKELEERVKEVTKEMEDIKVKKSIDQKNKLEQKYKSSRSYLLYNDEKIWVKSTIPNKCLARIDCSKSTSAATKLNNRKKLSLLHQSFEKQYRIKYGPGPLCKKQNLQLTNKDKWETQMAKLPKLTLEVFPKQGKPFCSPVIQRLYNIIGGELDTNKIEFAISAVKSKNNIKEEEEEPLQFPLEYHNKVEQVLTRRSRKINPVETVWNTPTKSLDKDKESSSDVVADVIEDLIRYVEIKELAPSLIKEDDVQFPVEDGLNDSYLSPTKDNISVFKKPHKKRTKVESELLRLSCKVVNVEIEENKDENVICLKPYCQLGCVCKSLKCNYIPTRHCQKPDCMFKCTCPKEKSIIYDKMTFPEGTNLLSEDTVNRIEDEAKKNLAKVEKEFTQTVIHTNDKTIVVGVGDRTKTRRAARVPAKFSDFVSSSDIVQQNVETFKKICVVSLHKLTLSDIIPYCLTHNMYNCFCKGLEVPPQIDKGPSKSYNTNNSVAESHELAKNKSSIDFKSKKVKHLKLKNESKKISKYISSPDPLAITTKSESENSSQDDLWIPNQNIDTSLNNTEFSKRPVRNIKRKSLDNDHIEYTERPHKNYEGCSRVTEIPKKYKRSLRYTQNIYQDDFMNNISDADLFRMKLTQNNKNISKADLLKQYLIEEKQLLDQGKNKTKRKQTLEARENDTPIFIECEKDPAIQRRKKASLQTVDDKIRPVFDGEVIIDKSNIDLLKVMGPRTVSEGYARLLPWTALIKSFHKKAICIWSMIDQPSRLLINKSDKKCPKNYMAIDKLPVSTEIITWIKKNKLPPGYQEDSLSFILRETKNNFEICGICTKNVTQKVDQQQTAENDEAAVRDDEEEVRDDEEEVTAYEEELTAVEEVGADEEDVEEKEQVDGDSSEIFYHKDMTGVERFFMLHKDNYEPIVLAEDKPDYFETKIPDLRVALPSTSGGCKWRMVFLNSDFSFLFFRSISYSIRYTDLFAMGNYAKTRNCTVRLENKGMSKTYEHELFGIYFVPRFSDRIFIGPYIQDCDSEDVDTLRYINQSLVSTRSFNLMRGKGDYKCGHWLLETSEQTPIQPKKSQPVAASESTIDLTSDNEIETSGTMCEITEDPSDKVEYYPFAPKIVHNEEEIRIIDAAPRKPEEFNRYIITNIPHFGYLGAYMHSHGEIDVSWPFENKLLRFSSESAATSFLQDRFSSLLQSVPETFKINIIVALNIDLKVYHPIDSAILNGHYVCGDFGCMNILEASDKDCNNKIGMSKEEVLKLFSKRAQNFVRSKLETLSYLLHIPKSENGGFDLPHILRKAAEEIHLQIRKERENRTIKNKLLSKKRENALKLYKLLYTLPEDQRNIENIKFRAILHKTEQLPIVINDSDDEGNKQESSDSVFQAPPTTSDKSPSTTLDKAPSTTSGKAAMKSILKPLVTVPVGNDNILVRMDLKYLEEKDPLALNTSPVDQPKYIPGVKLVKNPQGGFVLVNKDIDNKTIKTSSNNHTRLSNSESSANIDEPVFMDLDLDEQNDANQNSAKVTHKENQCKTAEVVVQSKTDDESDNKNNTEVIELDDDDVIPIENEPMIIDLDDFPSDDE